MSFRMHVPVGQLRHTNIAVVRLKKGGKRFEVACYKNKVKDFRAGIEKDTGEVGLGQPDPAHPTRWPAPTKQARPPSPAGPCANGCTSPRSSTDQDAVRLGPLWRPGGNQMADSSLVLQIERVFINVGKGEYAKETELAQLFPGMSTVDICLHIAKHGEVQLGMKEREHEMEEKKRDVLYLVQQRVLNPDTGRRYPLSTLEKAVQQAQFQVHLDKPTKDQTSRCVQKLQTSSTLPIMIAPMLCRSVMPPRVAAGLEAERVGGKQEPLVTMKYGGPVTVDFLVHPNLHRAVDRFLTSQPTPVPVTIQVLETNHAEEGVASIENLKLESKLPDKPVRHGKQEDAEDDYHFSLLGAAPAAGAGGSKSQQGAGQGQSKASKRMAAKAKRKKYGGGGKGAIGGGDSSDEGLARGAGVSIAMSAGDALDELSAFGKKGKAKSSRLEQELLAVAHTKELQSSGVGKPDEDQLKKRAGDGGKGRKTKKGGAKAGWTGNEAAERDGKTKTFMRTARKGGKGGDGDEDDEDDEFVRLSGPISELAQFDGKRLFRQGDAGSGVLVPLPIKGKLHEVRWGCLAASVDPAPADPAKFAQIVEEAIEQFQGHGHTGAVVEDEEDLELENTATHIRERKAKVWAEVGLDEDDELFSADDLDYFDSDVEERAYQEFYAQESEQGQGYIEAKHRRDRLDLEAAERVGRRRVVAAQGDAFSVLQLRYAQASEGLQAALQAIVESEKGRQVVVQQAMLGIEADEDDSDSEMEHRRQQVGKMVAVMENRGKKKKNNKRKGNQSGSPDADGGMLLDLSDEEDPASQGAGSDDQDAEEGGSHSIQESCDKKDPEVPAKTVKGGTDMQCASAVPAPKSARPRRAPSAPLSSSSGEELADFADLVVTGRKLNNAQLAAASIAQPGSVVEMLITDDGSLQVAGSDQE
eukprot:gene8441-1509_t